MTPEGPLVVERRVSAPPSAVYAYLTDSERWARWQGVDATIEARPGGLFRILMPAGQTARGQFVELVPDRRVVFTWGFVDAPGIPPGSTTVEIDLIPEGDATLVRLTHRGLRDEDVAIHRVGWEHYVPRLAAVASGADPGPDRGPGA
ncbi:MAG: SRPBCC family protein [Actinomycetota bacterium]